MLRNSVLKLTLISSALQPFWACPSEATLRQANLLKTLCDTKAVFEGYGTMHLI